MALGARHRVALSTAHSINIQSAARTLPGSGQHSRPVDGVTSAHALHTHIYRERAKRANTWMLNQGLSASQDVMMEISAVAWSIANDEFARKQDRVMALREI